MRFTVREAKIDPALRETFEQYGVAVMQQFLGTNNAFVHKGGLVTARNEQASLLPWLSEQYDIVERRETWLMVMEIAITVLVATELIFSIANFIRGH
jgi:hypothetical protein